MLTKAELLVAAKCAEKYPPGKGWVFLSCDEEGDDMERDGNWNAHLRISVNPALAQYG